MRAWNLYNSCFEIAARCNEVFSKSFILNVTRLNGLWIDATPTGNIFEAPYSIHMEASRGGNNMAIYLNFEKVIRFDNFTDDDLNAVAYSLGHGIADKITYTKTGHGFGLIFSEYLDYPEYENVYTYSIDGEIKTLRTDYPLLNHTHTEFETELQLCHEMGIKSGILNLTKNGECLFDFNQFISKPHWGIIRVEKINEKYRVSLNDNFFFKKFYLQCMSYVGQLSIMNRLPTIPQTGNNPYVEIFMTGDSQRFTARIERFRNYGLTTNDIKRALPILSETLGLAQDVDWANYLNF